MGLLQELEEERKARQSLGEYVESLAHRLAMAEQVIGASLAVGVPGGRQGGPTPVGGLGQGIRCYPPPGPLPAVLGPLGWVPGRDSGGNSNQKIIFDDPYRDAEHDQDKNQGDGTWTVKSTWVDADPATYARLNDAFAQPGGSAFDRSDLDRAYAVANERLDPANPSAWALKSKREQIKKGLAEQAKQRHDLVAQGLINNAFSKPAPRRRGRPPGAKGKKAVPAKAPAAKAGKPARRGR